MPAEYRTRALVLRTFDQGESDRIVHLFTEALGRVSAIAKGARRSRRRFPGTLELFSLLDVRLVDPPRAVLMRLEGARLAASFEGLGADLGRYALACLLVELLDRLTAERQANPDLLRFAVGVLEVVAVEEPDRLLAVLVLAKTIARLGFRPQLLSCGGCGAPLPDGGVRVAFVPREGGFVCSACRGPAELDVPARVLRALEQGIRTPLRDRRLLGLTEVEIRRVELLVARFFQFHIGFELRSAPFLQETLELVRVDGRTAPGDTAPSRSASEVAEAFSARPAVSERAPRPDAER